MPRLCRLTGRRRLLYRGLVSSMSIKESLGTGLVVEVDALPTCHLYGAATDTVSFLVTAVWLLPEAFRDV